MQNFIGSERQQWIKLVGQRKTFRGTIVRFGHKHRQGGHIKKGATLILTDVHQLHSKNKIDHVWLDFTPELAVLGEHLRPHGQLQFEATVDTYIKGGKNAAAYLIQTFNDLELTDLNHIQVIKQPYWAKKYVPLQDAELVSYVIRHHENLKQGTYLGDDPQHRLGKIKIGQGFANRFAKTLSWRWSNLLPKKYQ